MTAPQKIHVMIIGGGIGGLCLAQGLRRAGMPVTVYERSEARTDWLQGYRIHINPHGSRALHDSLPPAAWQQFLDSVSVNGGGFGFATEQLDDLLRFSGSEILPDAEPADGHYGASRISLREVLLSDLDDVVRLGKTFERYEIGADGLVTAHFSDGTSAMADVLIGADGANSRVRRQLLPHAERIDTGIVAIAGKYRLDGADLPARAPCGREHDHSRPQRLPVHRSVAAGSPRRSATTQRRMASCSTTQPRTRSGHTPTRPAVSRAVPRG